MTCKNYQQRLLASERPDRPSASIRRHLDRCPSCRFLQQRLLEVEQQIPLVPVPETNALAGFLQRFHEEPVPLPSGAAGHGLPGLTIRRFPDQPPVRERGLQKLSMALALVAALVLFTVGWWALPHQDSSRPPSRPDPLAARQAQRDQRLAAAHTPRERVELLADLADKLRIEAVALAGRADVDNLVILVRFYNEVVRDDLLHHARQLPDQERGVVIEAVAVRLTNTESHLQRMLATEPPRYGSGPLRDIAVAARAGHDRLRALLRS